MCTYENFIINHSAQLQLSNVPNHFWPTLYTKIREQSFDSGLSFSLVQIDYEGSEKKPYDPLWSVISIKDIEHTDPTHIYLIDHAWTFKPNTVISTLQNVPGLLDRLCNMLQIYDIDSTQDKIKKVYKNIWKLTQTYSFIQNDSVEDRIHVWYILDELGSAIVHSDTPNFRAVPFFYLDEQIMYTLLFPIKDVVTGEVVTRNYIESGYTDSMHRDALLIPWRHYEHFYEPFTQVEPSEEYFLNGHTVETLPNLEALSKDIHIEGKLKVYSEYKYINEYLTSPDFEIVEDEHYADILFYTNHYKTYKELSEQSPKKFVNQFPFEYIITVKDLLAIISRRSESHSSWLPTTFNLKTELPKFVSYYMQRKQAGLDNYWICKPYNLARGLDTYITDNLDFLCRLSLSGPKIAQKYLENPVLFERPDVGMVKFDIRYIILLTSVNPTEVFIYRNFFLRFSNKPFAMNNFEDYEQHFTVMNYNEETPLYRMMAHDFILAWNKQYPDFEWLSVEEKIFSMFRELFTAATMTPPPRGIAKSPQSRALYAADIMLCWESNNDEKGVQPKLLEINWMPDCQRACVYYPDFYNDIFSTMFLNKTAETCKKLI